MTETLATKSKPKTTNNESRTTNNDFEPLIVVFCCNWCSYSGADLAGTSRIQYPSNIRIIRVMCSGMVHPKLVLQALTKARPNGHSSGRSADGVMILGCHPGDCHYLDGNIRTQSRKEAIDLLLDDADIDRKRFRLEWVSASEGPRFAQVIKEMVDQVKEVGPNKPA